MKLLIVIVQDKDAEALLSTLTQKGYRATKMASTGGFLREGNSTIFLGVDDDKVEEILSVVRERCHKREHFINPAPYAPSAPGSYIPYPMKVEIGGATIFVAPIDYFERV
ncbi:MAG: cyclic-di-AMP receptor [Coprothermobacterota bacterium]|jgi:uncharacterized protein YaaQ|nr:cyclic-di-AMP receptor [Coprothermobacterota bacterium]